MKKQRLKVPPRYTQESRSGIESMLSHVQSPLGTQSKRNNPFDQLAHQNVI